MSNIKTPDSKDRAFFISPPIVPRDLTVILSNIK